MGAALRSGDSMLQAEEVGVRKKYVTLLHLETGEEIGMCTFEEIEDKNCKNVKETRTCKYIPCA